ncbi:MAG TPA: hypothetical protein VGI99_11790 [Gemmataceae bacterium]
MVRRFLAMLAAFAFAAGGFAEQPPTHAPSSQQCIVYSVRIVAIPATDTFEGCPAKEGDVALLSDVRLKEGLTAIQNEGRARVMQAPKLTAEVGKEAIVRITEEQSFLTSLHAEKVNGQNVVVGKQTTVQLGTTLAVNGRVAADGKRITLDVDYKNKRVVGPVEMVPVVTQITPILKNGKPGKPRPFTQYLQVPEFETHAIAKKGLTLAEGQAAIVAGPQFMQTAREEARVPVLSEIPYFGRMFRNVGISQTPVRELLIVSASVIELKD